MRHLFDHPLTKADALVVLVTVGRNVLACGCKACGDWCPRCECLVSIARAMLSSQFSRDELQALHADLTDEGAGPPPPHH